MKRTTTYTRLAHGLLFLLAFAGCLGCPVRDGDDDSGESSSGTSGTDTESGTDAGSSK